MSYTNTHTPEVMPGPWQAYKFKNQDVWAIGPTVGERVCDAYGEHHAKMVAALPSLLDALQDARLALLKIAAHPKSFWDTSEDVANIDAAIAKAVQP
jgi:hypothetical protein